MNKLFLGSIISFCLSLLAISIVKNAIITTEEPILKTIPRANINKSVAKVINIKAKTIKKAAVTKKTDYLNSWKLSATVTGTTAYAMVIKGRDSKVLRLNDGLESYTVKKILKSKVLFVNGNESVWLYIKSAFKKVNNNITKVPMPKVTYIEYNGKKHEIEIETGLSIMEGAIQNGIPGIDADCGGACACATCHVYVDEEWLEKLQEQSDSEKDMLDFAFETKKNSRLSCQLILEDKHDGIVVNLPEKQG